MSEPRNIITREAEGGAIGAGLGVIAGTAASQVKLPTGANQRTEGVTGHKAVAAGDLIPVVVLGPVKALAAAAIARNDLVMVNGSNGRFAPIGTTAGANYHAAGFALSAAAADGDEFDLFALPQRPQG